MDDLVLQFCPASFGLDLAFRKYLNVEEVQGVTRFIFRGDMSVASKVSSITKIPLEQEINSAVSFSSSSTSTASIKNASPGSNPSVSLFKAKLAAEHFSKTKYG